MPPERWTFIQDVFEQALARPPEARAALLGEACAEDHALRREVESLLDAFEGVGPFDALASELVAPLAATLQGASAEGRRVGPYRVLREIGRGGMGCVYLAERADGAFEQQVALKLVRYRTAGEDLLIRFLNERQILARLQHPGIARLLDGGMTEPAPGEPGGQPFFAMEYVEGQPLDAYCDERQLSITERLKLFVQVGEAVQYAHQNLIVHRDLKPSNLLVTEAGADGKPSVKLLDFGVAKLLEEAEEATGLTRTGQRLMTPSYASPELVRGGAVTTASDVFQLGVVFYELLAGRRPHRLDALTPAEVERVLCEEEPPKPSAVVSRAKAAGAAPEQISRARGTQSERLRRRLSGDLDTIALKALQKEPGRRYASAEAFVEDVKRHLAGRPVTARSDTPGYRMRKFVRRHRVGVLAAALVVLSLVGGLAAALWQARVAAAERDRARQETAKAEQVSGFLIDLFEAPDPSEALGDTLTAHDLLARGTDRVNRELIRQPLLRATMLNTLGRTYLSMGRYDRASALLDSALVLRRRQLGVSSEVIQSMSALGLAEVLGGHHARAESLYTAALIMQREQLGEAHEDVAGTLVHLASLQHETGRYEDAEDSYRQALDLMRALYDAPDAEYAGALHHLALLYQEMGRYEDATPLFEESLAMQRTLLGSPHPELALLLNDFGMMLQMQGRLERAEVMLREAVEMQRQLFGREHPQLVFTLSNLAAVVDDHDLEEADRLTSEALRIARSVLEPTNPVVATTLNLRAQVVQKRGALEDAQALFEEALAAARRAFPEGHPRIGWAQVGLGGVLLQQDRAQEAEPQIREGWQVLAAAFGREHPVTQRAEVKLTEVLEALGRSYELETLRTQHTDPAPEPAG